MREPSSAGEPVERLFYRKGDNAYERPSDIPFIAKQTRIVLENCGNINSESIDEYIAAGGFDALAKALFDMTPDQVIDEVDKSGLRGRGGGGFLPGGNGNRWPGRRKRCATLYVTEMRVTPEPSWTAVLWKVTPTN